MVVHENDFRDERRESVREREQTFHQSRKHGLFVESWDHDAELGRTHTGQRFLALVYNFSGMIPSLRAFELLPSLHAGIAREETHTHAQIWPSFPPRILLIERTPESGVYRGCARGRAVRSV